MSTGGGRDGGEATETGTRRERSARRWLAPALAGVVIGVALAAWQFPASGNDDTHITYWAAHALARLGKIVNYNGEAIEQSSSLGFVLLLAAVERLTGLALPDIAWALSGAFGAASIVAVGWIARRFAPGASIWAPLVLATSFPFLYWSTSGMEMSLTALLGVLVVQAASAFIDAEPATPSRSLRALGAAAAITAFVLIRPETPFVALGVAAAAPLVLVFRRYRLGLSEASRIRRALALLAFTAVAVIALAAFRKLHFGSFVPNPAAMKSGGFSLGKGASYLWSSAPAALLLASLLALVPAAAAIRRPETPLVVPLTLALALLDLGFVLASGGDWMPAARLLVPGLPALAILIGNLLAEVGRRARLAAPAIGLAALLIALDLVALTRFADSRVNASYRGRAALEGERFLVGPARRQYTFSELANQAHRRDARLLGVLLDAFERIRAAGHERIHVMSGQAGMVPYHLAREHYGALHFLDLFALTSTELLKCVPQKRLRPGVHGIRVDLDYLLSRADEVSRRCGLPKPEILFNTGTFQKKMADQGYRRIYQGPKDLPAYVAVRSDVWDQVQKLARTAE